MTPFDFLAYSVGGSVVIVAVGFFVRLVRRPQPVRRAPPRQVQQVQVPIDQQVDPLTNRLLEFQRSRFATVRQPTVPSTFRASERSLQRQTVGEEGKKVK